MEAGRFLEDIDVLVSAGSPHRTAVAFSVRSMLRTSLHSDLNNEGDRWFRPVELPDAPPASYWEVGEHLSRSSRTFDLVVLPEEGMRADDRWAQALGGYDVVVLPDVWGVSRAQHDALLRFVGDGGRAVVHGVYGQELPPEGTERLLRHPHVFRAVTLESAATHVTEEVVADLGPLGL